MAYILSFETVEANAFSCSSAYFLPMGEEREAKKTRLSICHSICHVLSCRRGGLLINYLAFIASTSQGICWMELSILLNDFPLWPLLLMNLLKEVFKEQKERLFSLISFLFAHRTQRNGVTWQEICCFLWRFRSR